MLSAVGSDWRHVSCCARHRLLLCPSPYLDAVALVSSRGLPVSLRARSRLLLCPSPFLAVLIASLTVAQRYMWHQWQPTPYATLSRAAGDWWATPSSGILASSVTACVTCHGRESRVMGANLVLGRRESRARPVCIDFSQISNFFMTHMPWSGI